MPRSADFPLDLDLPVDSRIEPTGIAVHDPQTDLARAGARALQNEGRDTRARDLGDGGALLRARGSARGDGDDPCDSDKVRADACRVQAVSYTHLTLPTIYSV